ncbi:MAG: hypothetical protein ACE5IR_24490 [bacterium]
MNGNPSENLLSSYCIEFQPQLVEDAVLRAIAGHADQGLFREERNALYHMQDDEAREEAFQLLHQRWFERIGLHEPLEQALTYWPILHTHTHRCLLVKASTKKEIGAELFVAEDHSGQSECEIRSVVIRLIAELLIQSEPFLNFLRRELLHVVDMLDPEFGYEPNLPKSEIGPTYDRLQQERYRILWDITIDGRLQRNNFLPASVRETHWTIFKNVFPGLREELERVFNFFFYNTSPKHEELALFSLSPETWLGHSNSNSESKGICPLCHFPSHDLVCAKSLSTTVLQEIGTEHPSWNPLHSICRQCADLYELRHSVVKSS